MSEAFFTAIIAGCVSLIVAIISYISNKRQLVNERQKLERELERKFTEKLYDLRLKHYPKAFQLTESLGKVGDIKREDLHKEYCEVRDQLREWKSGEVGLVMSDEAYNAFIDLEQRLKKNPARAPLYDKVQIDKIWLARLDFRKTLKNDLGLLFNEEKDENDMD